jgi:hypothetical protein
VGVDGKVSGRYSLARHFVTGDRRTRVEFRNPNGYTLLDEKGGCILILFVHGWSHSSHVAKGLAYLS